MKHAYLVGLAYLTALEFVVNATITVIDTFDRRIDVFSDIEATTIDETLMGYIELADPPDSCTNVAAPSFPTNYTMKKFALVNGTDDCDLMTKIQNVAAVGYDVAIVFNPYPQPFEYNITFPIPKSETNLSVVIVLYEDGMLIKNNYLFHNRSGKNKMILKIDPSGLTWEAFWLQYFCGLVIMLPCVCLYYMIKCFCKWNKRVRAHGRDEAGEREAADEIEAPQHRARLSSEEYHRAYEIGQSERLLKSLNKTFPLVEFATDDKYDRCAVCVSHFEVGEYIRVLKCDHVYHPRCIDPWLLEYSAKKTCPCCVKKIFWESSCEESDFAAMENTPLLGTSCPNYSGDLFVRAQGSINHLIVSDEYGNV